MESQLALTGKDYTLIVSDTNSAMSIIRMKADEDKMKKLSEHLVMAYNGEPGLYNCLLLIGHLFNYMEYR